VTLTPGQRVFHRRADAFASVVDVDGEYALVKYEWPFDPKWEPQRVPRAELVNAAEVEHG
jgi:hypothetical protein